MNNNPSELHMRSPDGFVCTGGRDMSEKRRTVTFIWNARNKHCAFLPGWFVQLICSITFKLKFQYME